jgi:hypothetical protein
LTSVMWSASVSVWKAKMLQEEKWQINKHKSRNHLRSWFLRRAAREINNLWC